MANKKIFIAIAGNIGTGKSTLTQLLSDRLGWEAHYEAVQDNPYLRDFYKDMKRWSFPLQIYFLTNRFHAHQKVVGCAEPGIQDRSIYEDANIFARNLYEKGLMEERDYRNYLELYSIMCNYLTPPNLVIYLRKSLPVLKARIEMRARDFESAIPDDYLANLNHYYDEWMDQYSLGQKLILESDHLDFLGNSKDFEHLVSQVRAAVGEPEIEASAGLSKDFDSQGVDPLVCIS